MVFIPKSNLIHLEIRHISSLTILLVFVLFCFPLFNHL